jgi:hypothetical protein
VQNVDVRAPDRFRSTLCPHTVQNVDSGARGAVNSSWCMHASEHVNRTVLRGSSATAGIGSLTARR